MYWVFFNSFCCYSFILRLYFPYFICFCVFCFLFDSMLCRLRSIATHRDHFVRRLSVRPSVCLSVRPSVTPQSYVSQATHAFLGMLPLYLLFAFRLLFVLVSTIVYFVFILRPIWNLHMFYLRPILFPNLLIFRTWGLCASNIPRCFLDFALCFYF